MQVLPYVGSDHFPMLIELSCAPETAREHQGESTPKRGDHEAADEIVQEQADREAKGEGQAEGKA